MDPIFYGSFFQRRRKNPIEITMGEEKMSYLESLGLSIEEIICEDYGLIFFKYDGNYYEISEDEISIGDSINSIISSSQAYSSCCGEILNTDWMICPECKEHC